MSYDRAVGLTRHDVTAIRSVLHARSTTAAGATQPDILVTHSTRPITAISDFIANAAIA